MSQTFDFFIRILPEKFELGFGYFFSFFILFTTSLISRFNESDSFIKSSCDRLVGSDLLTQILDVLLLPHRTGVVARFDVIVVHDEEFFALLLLTIGECIILPVVFITVVDEELGPLLWLITDTCCLVSGELVPT